MPIRFRCAYCNQLMAISRRKEGTVVRCPKCAGEIIVPSLQGTPAAEEPEPPGDHASAIAEPGLDFAATIKSPSEPAPREEPSRSVALPQRRGVFIPLGVLIALLLVNLLLIVLAVVLGLALGKSMGS